MEINSSLLSKCCALFALVTVQITVASPLQSPLPLKAKAFEHIQFGKIKANQFDFESQLLSIAVDSSA